MSCKSQKQELTPTQQTIINNAKENFVFVEGGTFTMGNNSQLGEAKHQVTLDGYSISKFETTWEEFDLYHILNGMEILKPNYRNDVEGYGPKYGAKKASWYTAQKYCLWLGTQLDLPLDLPTEAQWEYAARSRGMDVMHATDNGKIEGSYTQKRNYNGSMVKVGIYPPNPLGIYDMSGGKPEWTLDWVYPYKRKPIINPRFDSINYAKDKVVRGFHSLYNSTYLRGRRSPHLTDGGIGFRCVCNQKTPVK